MNRIKTTLITAAILIQTLVSQGAQTNYQPNDSNQHKLLSLNVIKTTREQRLVILLIDHNLSSSEIMLNRLAEHNIDFSSLIIIVLNHHKNSHWLNRFETQYAESKWIKNTNSAFLKSSGLNGTPMILGLQKNAQTPSIKWQINGLPTTKEFADITTKINHWTKK